MRDIRLAAAAVIATLAFIAYTRTLLPGVDLGDTGRLQSEIVFPETTARQAYPLYFATAGAFVKAVSPSNPARGLNLYSAVAAGMAVGLLAWVVSAVTGSVAGGAVAALMLAFSYTFWSQAVIAEVYSLHLMLVGLSLVALRAFSLKPSRTTLAVFCAAYALTFGNHLSAILLFIPFASFVLLAHPRPRELFRASTLALALLIAFAGALQYTPNVLAEWSSIEAPAAWHERLASFWFDVTKSDWRATMVLGADPSSAADRRAMWIWDASQQFGVAGLILAMAGAIRIWWISRAWAMLLWLAYICNTLFAITYNVGDPHVFFLPGHFFTAFAIGAAISVPRSARAQESWRSRAAFAVLPLAVLCWSAWRAWDTWPAADRHTDTRGEQLANGVMGGLSDRSDLLVARMNWDQEDALKYAGRYLHQDVAWVRLLPVLSHFPQLVADNRGIGRDVVLTADAAATVVAAYGDFFPLTRDERPATPSLSDIARSIPRGTPYVLSLLAPLPAHWHDPEDVQTAMRVLTRNAPLPPEAAAYQVIAGLAGERPSLNRQSQRPFRTEVSLAGDPVTIRMDGWLPLDYFRRGGFGHVILGRQPVLFIERGASLMWLGTDGLPRVAYAGNPYAPQPRFRIPAISTRLASR